MQTYIDLGFKTPDDGLPVNLGAPVIGGLAVPPSLLGPGSIELPGDAVESYVPAHELFHHVQYQYSGAPAIFGANWFMEASAEWGAERYMSSAAGGVAQGAPYAALVPEFLRTTTERLNKWGGFSGRQYGALAFADYFTVWAGPDYVRHVWERIGTYTFEVNEAQALAETAAAYGTLMEDELPYFWQAMYTLCGNPGEPMGSRLAQAAVFEDPTTFSEQAAAWCSTHINGNPSLASPEPGSSTYRPPHDNDTSADGTGSWNPTVGSGGAAYLDLAGTTATPEERQITITARGQHYGFKGQLRVIPWKENPADGRNNWSCSGINYAPMVGVEPATLVIRTNSHCPHLTVMLVSNDPTATGLAEWQASVDWSA